MTLLPDNLSNLEKAFDEAIEARSSQFNTPVSTLWDPWNCPIKALPYLAWALSVDYWQSDWSEEKQRKVVAEAMDIHRVKGSRKAVEKAVASIWGGSEITEWWEVEPKGVPGTFHVDALVTTEGIDKNTLLSLINAINASKRLSAHFTVQPVLTSNADDHHALYTSSAMITTLEPYVLSELNSYHSDHHALFTVSAMVTTLESIS